MKRVIKSSWDGTYPARRKIDDMIDNGATYEEVHAFIDSLVASGMSTDDAKMLNTFADECIHQAELWRRNVAGATKVDGDKLTTSEIKELLLDKLVDEGWDNVRKDQVIVKQASDNTYTIQIKDYEHITFSLELEEDDDEYQVWYKAYYTKYPMDEEFSNLATDAYSYIEPEKSAIKTIGYYIGTHF